MGKIAIDVWEQIKLLESRGMAIKDKERAQEVSSDVGYYRLGFHWFPFETTYPNEISRTHQFREGTNFDYIVRLYYFDFNLRSIPMKYLNCIEIHLRTFLVYKVSNYYRTSPTWFADPNIVTVAYIRRSDQEVYTNRLKSISIMQQHHKTHINDKYAPAWKTLECMTLGGIIHLFKALKNQVTHRAISERFKVRQLPVFERYLGAVLTVRNYCAHDNVLYDVALPTSIRRDPAGQMESANYHELYGAIEVTYYMTEIVSVNRQADLKEELIKLFDKNEKCNETQNITVKATGIKDIRGMLA